MKDKKIDEGDLTACGIDTKIDQDNVVRLNEQLFLGLALKTEGDAVDLARADRHELGPRGVRWVELIQMTSGRFGLCTWKMRREVGVHLWESEDVVTCTDYDRIFTGY